MLKLKAMVRKKMQSALQRNPSSAQAITDGGAASLPIKSLEKLNVRTQEESAESPAAWRNCSQRCAVLTFLTVEPDGNWRIVAVPLPCSDHTSHPTMGAQLPVKNSRGSHARRQFGTKAICSHRSSGPKSTTSNHSSDLVTGGSPANYSFDVLSDDKDVKAVRMNKSKKTRKKTKQRKKLPSNGGSIEPALLPEEYGAMPCGAALESSVLASFQDDLEGNENGKIDSSGAPQRLTSHNVPDLCSPNFDSEGGLKNNDSLVSCSDSPSSSCFSDARGSLESDSISVSSNGEESIKIDISAAATGGNHISRKGLTGEGNHVSHKELPHLDNHIGKKSNQVKTVLNSSSRLGNVGNHRLTGKENSHPVWQKVQKKVVDECELKKACSAAPLIGEGSKAVESRGNEVKKQSQSKGPGKLKKKHSVPKPENGRNSRKASFLNKAKSGSSSSSSKGNVNLKKKTDRLPQLNKSQSGPSNTSESGSQSPSPRFRSEPEAFHESHVCADESQPPLSTCGSASTMDNECAEYLVQESSVETNNLMCHPHLLTEGGGHVDKVDTEGCKQKCSSGFITQKWVPVGTKHSATSDTYQEHHHDESCIGQNLESDFGGRIGSILETTVPSSVEKVQTEPLENPGTTIADSVGCIDIDEIDENSAINFDKIVRAVNNVCQIQLETEAVQMMTGGPIAEFERLLYVSSPEICQSRAIMSCKRCSNSKVFFSSLCQHETPDIQLEHLWLWYEQQGSFGLEVRGVDYNNSKRLGMDRFSFRAYFVPYLSAVQLFKSCKRQTLKGLKAVPGPRGGAENLLHAELTGNETSPQPVDVSEANKLELLFEYFELEQPQQRRPLYEKIKELIRGEGLSERGAYGDPSKLSTVKLQELDCRSWYSVAWYPIYRIPDGNFRAAFLTYHSLGHLAHRSPNLNSNGVESCIVSPTVGLQSYNAQGECWFQLRPSFVSQTAGIPSFDPSAVMKERLRTLEEAASAMSRAVVSKGNVTSVNYHPDYEFFLSRRRY